MPYKNLHWRLALSVLVGGFTLITAFTISSIARTNRGPVPEQDAVRLENRINQLEQRLYIIETNVRNLEQQTRVGSLSSRSVSQEEVALLRAEIQRLGQRLADDECGLAKLDERTLSREVRDARRRSSAGSNDPCRLQVDTPLRLPDAR
jgi:hypothetical protein